MRGARGRNASARLLNIRSAAALAGEFCFGTGTLAGKFSFVACLDFEVRVVVCVFDGLAVGKVRGVGE
jgi:hypothetical protein